MKRDKFGYGVFALGFAGYLVRRLLYTVGVDSRGLLVGGHGLEIALWVLTAGAAVLALTAKPVKQTPKPWVIPTGCWFLAIGMLFAGEDLVNGFAGLRTVLKIAAPLVAAALAAAGWRKWKGQSPVPMLWAFASLVLVVRLVAAYQTWSREPQMMDYIFSLLASLCFAVFTYQQAARGLGMAKNGLWQLRFGLLGGYFGLVAGVGKQPLPFYTLMACGVLLMLLSGEEAPC